MGLSQLEHCAQTAALEQGVASFRPQSRQGPSSVGTTMGQGAAQEQPGEGPPVVPERTSSAPRCQPRQSAALSRALGGVLGAPFQGDIPLSEGRHRPFFAPPLRSPIPSQSRGPRLLVYSQREAARARFLIFTSDNLKSETGCRTG